MSFWVQDVVGKFILSSGYFFLTEAKIPCEGQDLHVLHTQQALRWICSYNLEIGILREVFIFVLFTPVEC